MITGSSSIVGEPFKKYVADQIDVRQSIFAAGLDGTNRTPQQLQYINGSNSWIKMASSVSVDDDRGKAKLREIFSDTETSDLLGTNLAKNFVLFNGLSFFNNPFQRAGVASTDSKLNASAYGTLGTEFGLQAMPGIQGFTVANANRGSIRTGEIQIRANSEEQFNVLELLYIRLGYTMLVEWGNGIYFDNDKNFQTMGPSLIDDGTWFDTSGTTHLEFFDKIEKRRQQYNGNYDAFFCKVTNFDWTFTTEGHYEITLSLISLGDVVESFKINTLPNDTIIKEQTEEGTNQTEVNQSAIANFLYCLRKESLIKDDSQNQKINIEKNNSDIVSVFPLEEGKGLFFKDSRPEDLYYIRLGYFNEWFENNVLDHIKNESSDYFPIFEMIISDENYMQIFPGLVSTNPRKCYIENVLPKSKDGQILGNRPETIEARKYFKSINEGLNSRYIGRIMDIYLNFDFILQSLNESINPINQKVDFFSFYKKICDGINSCFGGYVNLKVIIAEENKVEFFDDCLPVRTGRDGLPLNEEDSSPEIKVYGLDEADKKANFVRNFGFSTKISNDLATTISIGATADNKSTSELSDFFTRLNRGLKDRFQQERVDGNPDKKAEQKIECAEETKEDSFGSLLWEKIKYEVKRYTKFFSELIPDQPELQDLTKYDLYVEYLTKMFGTKEGPIARYFSYKDSDISRGSTILSSFINSYYKSVSKGTKGESTSSIIGFIPIELQLEIDGLSGMKIYNQVKIDTKFLPRDYPNVVEFVVSGIKHTISDNQWTTTLDAISKPGKNLTPLVMAKDESSFSDGEFFDDTNFEEQLDPELSIFSPINRPIRPQDIRSDGGGDGSFGSLRASSSGVHRGVDISTNPGNSIFAPIPGRLQVTKASADKKLRGFKIIGAGDYEGMTVFVFYAEPLFQYINEDVSSGTRVAIASDLSVDYPENVTDHVHLAIKKGGTFINPENVVINLTPKSIF